MISLKFKDFMESNYDNNLDLGACLYMLKDGENLLYIGITSRGIWNRWFDGWHSHITRNYEGKYFGCTEVGETVMRNMPTSLDWSIEFYSTDDCKKVLDKEFNRDIDIDMVSCLFIRHCEAILIARLNPKLNARYG